MNADKAAERCKLPPMTIRYHDQICVVRPAGAHKGNHMDSGGWVHGPAFMGQVRGLEFNIRVCPAHPILDDLAKELERET